MDKKQSDMLKAMREPFPDNQIGKRPQGGTMLDFVGHAALTDRLLDVDPQWNWEPLAYDERGLPLFDGQGGLWIKLTIAGVTRLGYGDGGGKKGGNAIKEAIGDALRNSGMRFGAALELWHKGDLHAHVPPEPKLPMQFPTGTPPDMGEIIGAPSELHKVAQAWIQEAAGQVAEMDAEALLGEVDIHGDLDRLGVLYRSLKQWVLNTKPRIDEARKAIFALGSERGFDEERMKAIAVDVCDRSRKEWGIGEWTAYYKAVKTAPDEQDDDKVELLSKAQDLLEQMGFKRNTLSKDLADLRGNKTARPSTATTDELRQLIGKYERALQPA